MSDQVMACSSLTNNNGGASHIILLSQVDVNVGRFCFFRPADVEKRANPVCHFVTPLDGNIESDINRSSEVNVGGNWIMMSRKKKGMMRHPSPSSMTFSR